MSRIFITAASNSKGISEIIECLKWEHFKFVVARGKAQEVADSATEKAHGVGTYVQRIRIWLPRSKLQQM
jgi:hypothetical protein